MTLRLHKTGIEFPDGSWQYSAQSSPVFKNLLINSDMRIDQRNGGSAITVNANAPFYPVDRFQAIGVATAGVFTAQQVSESPDGTSKSLKFTVTNTASSGAYRFQHHIEGNNVAHFGFGQPWAKTFTLSFWVKSSVTGTYSGSFRNSDHNRTYVYEYTIDTADTWEKKTITLTADTTGTWLTDNGAGLKLTWNLGKSSVGSADSWQSGNYFASANQTEWIATSGATFYISQPQLEVGETATDFEHLPYDVSLSRCFRYYKQLLAKGTRTAQIGIGRTRTTGLVDGTVPLISFPSVDMRTAPTLTMVGDYQVMQTSTYVDAVISSTSTAGAIQLTGTFRVADLPVAIHTKNTKESEIYLSAEL